MTTIQKLAEEALKYFVRKSVPREYLTMGSDRPQWVFQMAMNAHNDMLPDDYKFEFIVEALTQISEHEDLDEIEMPEEIYTSNLTKWLASNLRRPSYCDDALSEYGGDLDDTVKLLALGYQNEQREVLGLVRSFLEKQQLKDEA